MAVTPDIPKVLMDASFDGLNFYDDVFSRWLAELDGTGAMSSVSAALAESFRWFERGLAEKQVTQHENRV